MELQIDAARREGTTLILTTKDAARFMYHFHPGLYAIDKAKKKRSLDANAYLWVLVGKIAAAVGIPTDEVYRNAIRDAGEFTPLPIRADAVEEFSRVWGTKGTGWFVDILDDSKLPGYKLVRAYNGSSSYDTKQMSRLIDYVVQDAKSLDIETMTERELSLLKEGWR